MNICYCYHDEPNFLHKRGICYGTKEKEACSCNGNPAKCDFYEEVRQPCDEGIKIGAKLAAMHEATPTKQSLERAYFDGLEYGMKRRDVRPVVRGRWVNYGDKYHPNIKCCVCGQKKPILLGNFNFNFCPNCGAKMEGS